MSNGGGVVATPWHRSRRGASPPLVQPDLVDLHVDRVLRQVEGDAGAAVVVGG